MATRAMLIEMRGRWLAMTGFVARLFVGAVLITAGFSKAVGPTAEFAAAIEAYHILPASEAVYVAMALPWLELWVGTFLFFGYFTRFFGGVSAALFALFLGVLLSSLMRGIDLSSCGCFGAYTVFTPRQTMALDAVWLTLSLAICVLSNRPPLFSLDSWMEK